jgi:hypothetical protein
MFIVIFLAVLAAFIAALTVGWFATVWLVLLLMGVSLVFSLTIHVRG